MIATNEMSDERRAPTGIEQIVVTFRRGSHHAASSTAIATLGTRVDWSSQRVAYTGEPQSGGRRGRSEVVRTEIPPPARLRRILQAPRKRLDGPRKLVPTGLSGWDRQAT